MMTPQSQPKKMTITKRQETINFVFNVSLFPILLSCAAFYHPVKERLLAPITEGCSRFGWRNPNYDICDHRIVDVHAWIALAWLAMYSVQIISLRLRWKSFHRAMGNLGMLIAFAATGSAFVSIIHDDFFAPENNNYTSPRESFSM